MTSLRRICTIELIAEGHAERCPGEDCAFWHDGCLLEAVEVDLQERPEVAALLLTLRREIEAGAAIPLDDARAGSAPRWTTRQARPAGRRSSCSLYLDARTRRAPTIVPRRAASEAISTERPLCGEWM